VRSEHGQATIEWVGLVLLASVLLAGAAAVAGPQVDGRSFGGFLAHRLVCAVRGGCDDGDAALAKAYGSHDAELVRRHAPNMVYEPGERELPVDWRECRKVACSTTPDDRDLDAHRSHAGRRATVFTRLIHRGGKTYLQYWFYYPDSNTYLAGSDKLWRALARFARAAPDYPGWHPDDWEGYQVRVDRRGNVNVRSTSHGDYKYCKQRGCGNRWGPATGWTRVSRGSHAGHIPLDGERGRLPGRDMRERTSTADGLRLIPLELVDGRSYRPLHRSRELLPWRHDKGVAPPWRKPVYRDPENGGS
jgi:hypothetical protein